MNKKRNNKGFSLVELIVVIAVMAVLVVVLAPAYLRYVEKARVQKDASAFSELTNAINIVVAEEDVYDEISIDADAPTTVKVSSTGEITVDNAVLDDTETGNDGKEGDLYDAIVATVGASLDFASDEVAEYFVVEQNAAAKFITITIEKDNGAAKLTVTGPAAFN